MYFEIWKNDTLIKRGKQTLEPINFENELMYVPNFDLVLPIDWAEYFDGWEEVKVYINGKCLYGLVWDLELDKAEEKLTVSCRHIISEWEHRQISVNHAKSDKNLNVVYKGEEVERSKKNDETITASNFAISAKALKKMTKAKWIAKANARAWVTSNGDKVKIAEVDHSDVKKKEGTYDVIFKTAKGTSVEVECEVKENISYNNRKSKINKQNQEVVSAKGFTADIDMGLSVADVKDKIDAKAWVYKSNPHQKVNITSITTDFVNKVGVYVVTASTAAGSSVTVKVTIEDGTGYGDTEPSIVDKLEDIYNNMEFAYPGWEIDIEEETGAEMIDYVYSKQNKLEALTQTMELTPDSYWRVGWWNYKKVELGKFGEIKPYTISTKPSGEHNIRIISEPVVDYDFENVINVATVYSDKSDSGMASLTLREVYNEKKLIKRGVIDEPIQDENFPVVILRGDVNNERDYLDYLAPFQPVKVAPNNELEFAVLDIESIALESGRLIEGAFAFNDLNPFEEIENAKRITDRKRAKAAKGVYKAAIRKLLQNRRAIYFECQVEEVPPDLLPGDKVRLIYDNDIWNIEACSSYYKKVLAENDYFYITSISYEIDETEAETNTIRLCKWLKVDRDTQIV